MMDAEDLPPEVRKVLKTFSADGITMAYMCGFSDAVGWSSLNSDQIEAISKLTSPKSTMAMMALALKAGAVFARRGGGDPEAYMESEPHDEIAALRFDE